MYLEIYATGVDYMVDPRLTFYTFRSFYERSKFIREVYQTMSINEKYIYKYYVYSRRSLSEKTCDIIWEYINAEDDFILLALRSELAKELHKYD